METQVNFLQLSLNKIFTTNWLTGYKVKFFLFCRLFSEAPAHFFQSRTFLSSHCSGTDFYDRVYDEAYSCQHTSLRRVTRFPLSTLKSRWKLFFGTYNLPSFPNYYLNSHGVSWSMNHALLKKWNSSRIFIVSDSYSVVYFKEQFNFWSFFFVKFWRQDW